jgi:hypothetical protein
MGSYSTGLASLQEERHQDAHPQRKGHVRTQPQVSTHQTRTEGLGETHSASTLILDFQPLRKQVSLVQAVQAVAICSGGLSRLTHPWRSKKNHSPTPLLMVLWAVNNLKTSLLP